MPRLAQPSHRTPMPSATLRSLWRKCAGPFCYLRCRRLHLLPARGRDPTVKVPFAKPAAERLKDAERDTREIEALLNEAIAKEAEFLDKAKLATSINEPAHFAAWLLSRQV